jgi:DNA gyrase subunit B
MSEEIKKDNYSADSIQALEGMEQRMRPSMYIGDVGVRGHHLVYEVVITSMRQWVVIVIPFS